MATTLEVLARLTGGRVFGDPAVEIRGAAVLASASPGDITLVDRAERGEKLLASPAWAVVVPADFPTTALTMPALVVDDVHQAFTAIVLHFRPARPSTRIGVSPQAIVSPQARLADDVDVHPGATMGDDVEIGAGSTIHSGARIMAGCRLAERVTVYPNAVLYENTVVGPRSIIHAGVILGCHGFGYRTVEGRHVLSAQLGNVEIGADVEIGANSTIDRGTYGPTVIGEGTKIDNQVMIAHNCQIGRHNVICSQVGVAGSTTTGDYVVMAGQVGVRDHVHIGTGAVLGAMSGVSCDIPAGAKMMGIPATDEREQKIKQAALSKLPEMRRQLKQLQRDVEALQHGESPGNSAAA